MRREAEPPRAASPGGHARERPRIGRSRSIFRAVGHGEFVLGKNGKFRLSLVYRLTGGRIQYNMSLSDISLSDLMDNIHSHPPLREPTFFIMLSLSPGPQHGYAILGEVETLSEGRVLLSTGTLYGAIKRLLERDWISRVDDPEPNNTERPRKSYALTERGRRALNAELERLRNLVAVAQSQIAEETP